MAGLNAPYIGSGGEIQLDAAIFGEPFHEPLVHRVVTAELNARRRGTQSALTRGEVAMTGAKAWRQKGTGRARAGALSSPQRTGGGVAFAPKPRRFTVKVNRKEHRRALRCALSVHADRSSLRALDAAAFDKPSTKAAAQALDGFTPQGGTGGDGGRVLVVLVESEEQAALSFRNVKDVSVLRAHQVGVVDVIGAARLVASPAALDILAAAAAAPSKRAAASSEIEAQVSA